MHDAVLQAEKGSILRQHSNTTMYMLDFSKSTFNQFLRRYVDEQMNINDIKELYKENNELKFATKNHERNEIHTDEDLARWMVGVLGKLIIS